MHASLEGNSSSYNYEAELRVTYPLKACLQVLKERHLSISKLHNERYEQVKSEEKLAHNSTTGLTSL
jgi:protein regulator of cytokinesis 1